MPIILSTGMSTLSEITHAYEILVRNGASKKSISVLHCTSSYPATDDELNLRALISISNALNTEVGYSDHSIGKEASIAAVALGATIIEKHITIDRSMDGPDHKASMEIEEFKDFIQSIRRVSAALGMEKKEPSTKEKATLNLVRKSIVSAKKLKPVKFSIHIILLRKDLELAFRQLNGTNCLETYQNVIMRRTN